MPYRYAWEKLYNAVLLLVGRGTLQDRMNLALAEFHTLQEIKDGLPDVILSRLDNLLAAFNIATPLGNEGKWRASINAMKESELCKHAQEIVDLYDTVCRQQCDQT